MWVPEHVGIQGNEAADRAAEEILDKERTDDFTSFLDLKPVTAKTQTSSLWQEERDEAVIVSNKLRKILPKLADKLFSFCITRKELTGCANAERTK